MPDYRSRSASPKLSLARKTATLFSPVCPAPFGATRRIAGCIAQRMAAKSGSSPSKAVIFRPDVPPSRSIPMIRMSCSRRSGIFGAKAGLFVPVAMVRTRHRGADCFAPATAAIPGTRSPQRTARVFQKNLMAELRLRSHHRIRSGFTLLLNQPIARSSFPMMAAAPGTSAIRVSGWSGGPFTSPI